MSTIVWVPAPVIYGNGLGPNQLNAFAPADSGPFTGVYDPPAGTILDVGTHTLTVNLSNEGGFIGTASADVEVLPQTPQIYWDTPSAIDCQTPLSATQLSAAAGTAGTFIYQPGAGSLLPPGKNVLSVTFIASDTTSYLPSYAQVFIEVTDPLQAVTIAQDGVCVELDRTLGLTCTGHLLSGATQDLTLQASYSVSSGSVLGNVFYPGVTGPVSGTVSAGGFNVAFTLDVVPAGYFGPERQHLSHLTQEFLNYFDAGDQRARRELLATHGQLLNMPAQLLSDLKLRVGREQARFFAGVPANLDNLGVYWGAPLPSGVVLDPANPTLNQVTAIPQDGSSAQTFVPYDDRLAPPSGIAVDPSRAPVACSNPVIASVTGPQPLVKLTGIELPMPNQLTFWVAGGMAKITDIRVHIVGQTYPQSPWPNLQTTEDEVLNLSSTGAYTSIKKWASIEKITIWNLQQEALSIYSFPIQLPGVADPLRPYIHWQSRYARYSRYWSADPSGKFLTESYASDFGGLEPVQYTLASAVTAVAVEPWSYGMLVLSGQNLVYADRRTPLPVDLTPTNIPAEPAYGVRVAWAELSGQTASVTLEPVPYSNAGNVSVYRYRVTDPDGNKFCLLANGVMVPYSDRAGWRQGPPVPLTLPVLEAGDWFFSIDCVDSVAGQTFDTAAFPVPALTPLATLPLDQVALSVRDLAYDSWGQLWLWTGSYLVPAILSYQGYLLDATNNRIYFTQPVSGVSVS